MTNTNNSPETGQILDLASTLMNKSKFNEAIEALEKAAEIDPKNRSVLDRVIICNLELKRPKKALEAMNSILTLDPKASRIWADKAYLHFLLNEESEGIRALQQSLKLNPRNQNDWYLLGTAYMTFENWVEAREAFHNAIQLNPNSSITWYNLAACNYVLGDVGAALGAAEQAFAIDPILESLSDDWIDDLREEYDLLSDSELSFDNAFSAGS
ncbi:MAG: tetratricopeptide repeat protein [Candidatus Thorarchaeota archaeon]